LKVCRGDPHPRNVQGIIEKGGFAQGARSATCLLSKPPDTGLFCPQRLTHDPVPGNETQETHEKPAGKRKWTAE
jgi:hypothetical protein